ncbi:MAG: hypothetical protein HKP42_06705 [Maribacter sp.]|nr:hypothetical protein [Maribacter sp.]NNK75738.1 hypothetical protein [Maribacter sp.]
MVTKSKFTKADQTKKIEELHADFQQWKSHLNLMQDELTFIDHLLNSYIFEPNTPNLFERLQDYQTRLKKVNVNRLEVCQMITKHEKELGGMIECTDTVCDKAYYKKHEITKAESVSCLENFQNLKSEIFQYAGSILKRRKP